MSRLPSVPRSLPARVRAWGEGLERALRRLPVQPPVASAPSIRDRLLTRRLARRFERSPAFRESYGMSFYVFAGEVAVFGLVPSALERDLLVEMIRRVRGVRGVISHLRVEGEALPDDEITPAL